MRELIQWFAGGTKNPYMPSVHCMNYDWTWINITIVLSGGVMLGYWIISERWSRNEKLVEESESKAALRTLRHIFFWCGVCGYGFNIIRMFWPAWRLLDVAMVWLLFVTWLYVVRSRGMKAVYEKIGNTDRLETDLAYYRQIAETMPQIVWTARVDGTVDYFNERWYDFTGAERTDHSIKEWASMVHPDDIERTAETWNAARETESEYVIEYRLRGKDGQYTWFLARGLPMRDEDGHVARWLGTCTDIDASKRESERLRIESEKRRFFMNALSHDLRTPLNAIILHSQVATLAAQGGETNVATQSLNVIKENSTAATAMLNNLLEFARFSTNDKNTLELCNLSDLITSIMRRFDKAAEAKGVTLKGPSGIGQVTLVTDRAKVERIISNLVDNALKFTDKGTIAIEAELKGIDLEIAVSDTGFGISPEHQKLLFGEFFQAGNYERDRQKGFGMGLAISRVLAKQLGGDVSLSSSSDQGTRFVVKLPSVINGPAEREAAGIDR